MHLPILARWIVPLALLAAGCSIPPKPDTPPLRDAAPLAGVDAPAGRAWPDAAWWKHYGDEQLDALEEKALASAPTLEVASARFAAAEKAIDIARAETGVTIDGNAQYQRQRLSENGLIPPAFLGFTWYSQGDLGVQFRYDFDFWGRKRAAIEAAVSEARAAEAERASATLGLTTAIADLYFGWQADQARAALMEKLVGALEHNLRIADLRVSHEVDPPDVLYQARTRLAGAREQHEAYLGSARVKAAALAALLGIAPAELPALTPEPLPEIDASLPADAGIDLLARRPDIAASRWRVEAALGKADQARAAFYPDISIGALAGLSSIDMGKLFDGGSRVFDISPAIHLPIFEGGRLEARFGASKAELDAAAAEYDSAVVSAAHDVATQALTALELASRRRERDTQVAASRSLQATATARSKRGIGDDRAVIGAEAEVIQQQDAATALHAQALSTDIALIKALGGGYRFAGVDATTDTAASASASHKSPEKSELP
ncbi:MAG TPA: efflux transporter outer membrane subunit [Rhodanobacteraceae bacterium]|nr:efflux transporter outer membrane subunit [Rhodanobacteraceae bacterium]